MDDEKSIRKQERRSKINELFESETETEIFSFYEVKDKVKENRVKPKKGRRVLIIAGLLILFGLFVYYFLGMFYYKSHFLPSTTVNGIDVGGKTVEEALQVMNSTLYNRKVTIKGKNETNSVTGSEIGLIFENSMDGLNDLLEEQNNFLWQFYYFTHIDKDLNTNYRVEREKLNNVIQNLTLVSGPNVIAPSDAYIQYNGNNYEIVPSDNGNQPNTDKLKERLINDLVSGNTEINLKEEDLYNKPEVTSENPTLKENLDKLNSAIKSEITLNFPQQPVILDKSTFEPWLKLENGFVEVDENSLKEYISGLAQNYDNNNSDITFRASNGNTLTLKNDSGWQLDQNGETERLKEQILKGEITTVEPDWAHKGSEYLIGKTITGTYIEVNLTSQDLYFYKDNALLSNSSIVSGDVYDNHATEKGLFFVLSKNMNVNREVYTNSGSESNMQVKYWLPYTQNNGIESATWRNDFGGSIFLRRGTDGSIDAPLNLVELIYNNVEPGVPVVIY